jgi:hypothetical protein
MFPGLDGSMNIFLFLFVTWLLCVTLLYIVAQWNRYEHRQARKMLEEFQRRWPERCPLCSFARFVNQAPEPHENCPERAKE